MASFENMQSRSGVIIPVWGRSMAAPQPVPTAEASAMRKNDSTQEFPSRKSLKEIIAEEETTARRQRDMRVAEQSVEQEQQQWERQTAHLQPQQQQDSKRRERRDRQRSTRQEKTPESAGNSETSEKQEKSGRKSRRRSRPSKAARSAGNVSESSSASSSPALGPQQADLLPRSCGTHVNQKTKQGGSYSPESIFDLHQEQIEPQPLMLESPTIAPRGIAVSTRSHLSGLGGAPYEMVVAKGPPQPISPPMSPQSPPQSSSLMGAGSVDMAIKYGSVGTCWTPWQTWEQPLGLPLMTSA